jgi:hypothetical protein
MQTLYKEDQQPNRLQTQSEVHQAAYTVGSGVCVCGRYCTGYEGDHTHSYNTEDMYTLRYTFIYPYVLTFKILMVT